MYAYFFVLNRAIYYGQKSNQNLIIFPTPKKKIHFCLFTFSFANDSYSLSNYYDCSFLSALASMSNLRRCMSLKLNTNNPVRNILQLTRLFAVDFSHERQYFSACGNVSISK
ncbi:hypothetical protein ACOME3_002652 [Neoechinorhynchus agilis]